MSVSVLKTLTWYLFILTNKHDSCDMLLQENLKTNSLKWSNRETERYGETWLTVCGQVNHLSISQSQPGQLSLLPSAGRKKYQPKCGDALRLGSEGRYGSFHLWINVWMAGKTVIPR